MGEAEKPKRYDLEDRTFAFAERVLLVQEARELTSIFGAILRKSE